jgi:hypothetical protein
MEGMAMSHNRIVTPYTDPDRWTEEEKEFFDARKCCWDVGVQYFGQTDNLCGKPSKPGASFGHCAKHERELLENHWPDGTPRR